MKYEEMIPLLREGKQCINTFWNGIKLDGKIMYVTMQMPDEHSLNTEPYLMMHVGTFVKKEQPIRENLKIESETDEGGWVFQRFPWIPSVLGMNSDAWHVREWQDEHQGTAKECPNGCGPNEGCSECPKGE